MTDIDRVYEASEVYREIAREDRRDGRKVLARKMDIYSENLSRLGDALTDGRLSEAKRLVKKVSGDVPSRLRKKLLGTK